MHWGLQWDGESTGTTVGHPVPWALAQAGPPRARLWEPQTPGAVLTLASLPQTPATIFLSLA